MDSRVEAQRLAQFGEETGGQQVGDPLAVHGACTVEVFAFDATEFPRRSAAFDAFTRGAAPGA